MRKTGKENCTASTLQAHKRMPCLPFVPPTTESTVSVDTPVVLTNSKAACDNTHKLEKECRLYPPSFVARKKYTRSSMCACCWSADQLSCAVTIGLRELNIWSMRIIYSIDKLCRYTTKKGCTTRPLPQLLKIQREKDIRGREDCFWSSLARLKLHRGSSFNGIYADLHVYQEFGRQEHETRGPRTSKNSRCTQFGYLL